MILSRKIEDIIKRVQEIGADSVALTEHGNMSSFFKFYKAAREKNIKPILGCELYVNDLFYVSMISCYDLFCACFVSCEWFTFTCQWFTVIIYFVLVSFHVNDLLLCV